MLTKHRIEQFVKRKGRRPRILIGNLGQKSNVQDTRQLASVFAERGFDVDISPLYQTPRATARMAIENDVHFICLFSTDNQHKKLITELAKALKAEEAENVKVLIGGAIPETDYDFLLGAGVDQILNSTFLDTTTINQLLDQFD